MQNHGFTLIEPSHSVAQSPCRRGSAQAFTLIELSIVIVIIGLLVGGVMVGRDLIKAAAIRKTVSQIEQLNLAVNTFDLKYNALPGDWPAATQFYPAAAMVNCAYAIAALPATCNGDGNDKIGNISVDSAPYEGFLFLNHLNISGLITGNFFLNQNGTYSPPYNDEALETQLSNTFISLGYAWNGLPNWNSLPKPNHYYFIGGYPSEDHYSYARSLSPADAYALDAKMDDGIANTGIVRAFSELLGHNCTTASALNVYEVNNSDNTCALSITAPF